VEHVIQISSFSWDHEKTKGIQRVQPTEDDVVPVLDDTGIPRVDPSTGEPILTLRPDFDPNATREVELETIVVIDQPSMQSGSPTLIKLSMEKADLSHFLARYVEFLDSDGVALLRRAIEAKSGIVVPSVEVPKMSMIRGGKRK